MTTYPRPEGVRAAPSPAQHLPSPRAPADRPLRTEVRWKSADAIVVEVTGEIDGATATGLETTLCEHLRARPAALRVDLGEVSFLGTAGIRALQRIHLIAGEAGVHVVFDPGDSHAVRRAFAVLDRLGENPIPRP